MVLYAMKNSYACSADVTCSSYRPFQPQSNGGTGAASALVWPLVALLVTLSLPLLLLPLLLPLLLLLLLLVLLLLLSLSLADSSALHVAESSTKNSTLYLYDESLIT
jgi:hypothetical protein